MAGGTRIVAFDSANASAAEDEILLTEELAGSASEDLPWREEPFVTAARGWPLPVFGCVALVGWTVFFGWATRDRILADPTPSDWISLIRDWAVPVLLGAVVALLVLRNSRREALRFGDAARLLSEESLRLELRLTAVNRELSLAREFVGAQSRDLEALGRMAIDRLSTEADRMQGLIRDNHARVESIGTVSEAALDNMEKLRGQLPVIASAAKDVTNNIGNAGRTAHSQLQEMISGFKKLNEFGQASERQVHVLRDLVEETINEFARQAEQFGEIAAVRFETLNENGAKFRTRLETDEIEALAAVRSRASAMTEELEQCRQLLDGHEAESLTSMRARLTSLRDEGATISRALRDGENRALDGWRAGVSRMNDDIKAVVAMLDEAESEAIEAARVRVVAIGEELARFEHQGAQHAERFATEIDHRRNEAALMDEMAARKINTNLAEIDAELAERRLRHEQLDLQTADRLHQRFSMLEKNMAARHAQLETHGATIAEHADTIAARLGEFELRFAEIAAHGGDAEQILAGHLQALANRLATSRTALSGTGAEIADLTDASVRLLELIQASVKHSREELPQALAKGEMRLADVEARMAGLRDAAAEADAHGVHLATTIEVTDDNLRRTYAELLTLQAGLENAGSVHNSTLLELRRELNAISSQSGQLAEEAHGRLAAAFDELASATQSAISGFGESGAAAVSALARQLAEESAVAIEEAMQTSAQNTSGRLEHAAISAAAISRDAALQMRDQLAKVGELAANLESRVAHARQRAEEQVDNDFTRRVALITESLNSNAIDIAKALSTDVADTSWASYLRGDRGIFTRRAVSLIENVEAKAIVQIYQRDNDFHDHVSRYIHDFEAMLRQVLSARDGQALGVTLLSSDMGKLYVVLAQAIERLR